MSNEQSQKPTEDEGMDKLGVDEGVDQENLEKLAAKGCPVCGEPVEVIGNLLRCRKHGTEPFEKSR
jgi:predicted RNA-binding Zn-ribbon protein involved in translation (DUF1610 family)